MELTNIQYTGAGKKSQVYSNDDSSLISIDVINSSFGDTQDYIEYFIYDELDQLIDVNYKFENYKLEDQIGSNSVKYSSVSLDPLIDVQNAGYDRGIVSIQYNFLKKLFNSSIDTKYWIKDISTSRLELKLSSQTLSGDAIKLGVDIYQSYILGKNYYSDFYLNFGKNDLIIAVNAAYIEDTNGEAHLLIKLYEPLPDDYDTKSQLWIVDKIAESVSYRIEIQSQTIITADTNKLRGPNYNVKALEKIGQATSFYSYNSLFSSQVSSSIQKIMSYYEDKAISINVDFTNFENFIHFSSATERINNFVYKLDLIQKYQWQIESQQSIRTAANNALSISASINSIQNDVDKIIEKFDNYEYYLYYTSASYAWPKINSTQPYQLYAVTSSQVVNWLGSENTTPITNAISILYSASAYDNSNRDSLASTVPQYIYDDPENQPYIAFMNMIGQHFDNIWVYYKDITNRYNATNNPHTGVSLDIVADAIRSFGLELYTNTNLSDDIYYTLFGVGQSGTLLPPTGSEKITTYVTSSMATLPYDQIQKEIYKRIYHNLPYLLKTRGTERGVKALIACYGIPESILTVNEFGGNDRLDRIGLIEINNDKITIISQSLELSQSLLSPYSTVQYYDNDNRSNSTNLEIGFSPSDTLNTSISSSLGYFSIDDYIGNPGDQYSSSYSSLDALKNTYFQSYTKRHNIWEYIRLIKYYNNSLFKMVKDFVPARANVSTAIIVKPHILERNKYARHEPNLSNHLYSQSIDIVGLSATHATSYSGSSTVTTKLLPTSLGYIPYTSSFGFEKYTGEFQGSVVSPRYSNIFDQRENSNNSTAFTSSITQSYIFSTKNDFIGIRSDDNPPGIGPVSVLRVANFQNVFTAVRSQRFFDLDYSSNSLVPVNFNIITSSIYRSIINNYATYTDPNVPYAYLQDTNYYLRSFTDPRYYGSKSISKYYNTYTNGDTSYGNNAAIDKIKKYFAYLTKITPATLTLPYRANAQIKYLINDKSAVIDLSKANTNIFESQNIFKSGETLDISLFEYNFSDSEIQKLSNNSTLQIYQGGFRYVPILHNISGSHIQYFSIFPPYPITITTSAGGYTPQQVPKAVKNKLNWDITWNSDDPNPNDHTFTIAYPAGAGVMPVGNYTASVSFIWGSNQANQLFIDGPSYNDVTAINFTDPRSYYSAVTNDPAGNYYVLYGLFYGGGSSTLNLGPAVTNVTLFPWAGSYSDNPATNPDITQVTGPYVPGRTITSTQYISEVTSSAEQSCMYFLTGSNIMVFRGSVADFYEYNITYQSKSDLFWSASVMEEVVTPFKLSVGDEIHLYNQQIGWYESDEYVIKNSYLSGSGTSIRLYVELNRDVNLESLNGSLTPDPHYGWVSGSCRYIVVKKIPDETNIVIRYNPSSSIAQEGLLYPQYIDYDLRKNSGNVIKLLKSDNLI